MTIKLNTILILFFCVVSTIGTAQNTFKITGGNVNITDNVTIVLKDCQLQNAGTLTANKGTIELMGTAPKTQSKIGGTGNYIFHNLKINKTANDAQLGHHITVNNHLEMTSGHLDLSDKHLTLGTANGTIIGEREATRITASSTGKIIKTIDLNAPNAVNPGNIGVEITSTANLGITEIHRGHDHQTISTGNSVFRHYTISPTNNMGLNCSLTFHYLDVDLNGVAENSLVLHENNNGWMVHGFDHRDAVENKVSLSGYDALYQYTLGFAENDVDMDGIGLNMDNCPNDANTNQADKDNDMVGDVCDSCPNGNDMIDANTNGIIDDCECKGTDVLLTGIINQDSVYVASNTIQSNEILETAKAITYKANSAITLTTGFHAKAGSAFLATITPCQSLPPFAPLVNTKINTNIVELAETMSLTAHPNPVLTDTKINYFVPATGNITLSIQNLKGQQLALLVDNQRVEKGKHELVWKAPNLAAGIYLLQLSSSQGAITKKLVVLEQ